MTRLLTTLIAGTALTVGIATSAVYAQHVQAPALQPPSMGSDMRGHGMTHGQGGMMGGGMKDDMMTQMNQMMEHCNEMMQSRMQPPNSQFPRPEQVPNKG
jgi:Spy/CpxP family protein refolding chaperone